MRGADIELLSLVSSRLGFSIDYRQESSWIVFENGSWHGTLASVGYGVTDLGLGNVALSYDMIVVSGKSAIQASDAIHLIKSF